MRFVNADEIARALRSIDSIEPRVVVSGNYATPWELVRILDETLAACRAFVMNPQPGWPRRDGFVTETPFVGPGARRDPLCDFLPMRLSLVPRLFNSIRVPDAVLVQTSTPRAGKVSLGIEVNILPAAIEQVKRRGGLVIAQVNPQMPYTRGDAELDVDVVDLAIEVDGQLASPDVRSPDEAALAIGEMVASLCVDGATLQAGIGQVPDAALAQLHPRRRLGVWTEMISDGILALQRAGSLDESRPLVSTFLFGSPELYEWANENPSLTMLRTETVNEPGRIAQQPAMLSINTALQIDLYAQSNASYVNGAIYSGFGGQPDFVSGALHSAGGQAVIALRSWHDKTDHSNIVPLLVDPVCSFQHSVIVTEQGMAKIFGRSQHAQARLLIEQAAHPRAQDALWDAAFELGLLREGDVR
jgi:acyl-CoA hydrolase